MKVSERGCYYGSRVIYPWLYPGNLLEAFSDETIGAL